MFGGGGVAGVSSPCNSTCSGDPSTTCGGGAGGAEILSLDSMFFNNID